MRLQVLLPSFVCLPLVCLSLAACQGLGQDASSRPHANLRGSHVTVNDDRVDTFRVTAVDGWGVNRESGDQPSKTFEVDAINGIDAGRTVRVDIEGQARYRNAFRSLFWSPMRVEGRVEFVPATDALYVVHGEIGPQGSSVWLEDDKTHALIGHKFAVAAPEGAASAP